MLNLFDRSLIKTTIGLFFLMPLVACTAGRQAGLSNENQVFPPDQMLPLRVAISRPMVEFSYETGHQVLKKWNESPGQRRMLMNCTWSEGLNNFVHMMVPGTEVSYLGAGRDPLSAVGYGVQVETDTLGIVTFSLDGRSALDVARHRGWTHLIIPEHLKYAINDDNDRLMLLAPVAIIDVQEQRIVWQGIVDSRHVSAKTLGADDGLQPALTSFESVSYLFLLDLMEIMNRQLNQKPQSRHQFASACQRPAPLLQDGHE